ncbi:cryptochrome/photolyase family protein [Novosphingobium ginsenosidimutans]|uniref:Deoxyribodipyrimidine photo-lyase n=1 Tax=Novosphingobium ginsenosidimutans TaxID=1176536 RepID=A0A5B8S637_9SPHN|nr:deoxyribodipyrimidine photo-lyase [Novosphingobium ginsenosidimutans]QEA16568.1 deoxyribodipyrimidine photo-lyase [Novosphingobium ginsenosidimutans]
MSAPIIVWLRRDLRLADQPAFRAAAARGPVIPVYVLDDESPRYRRMGAASRWWLHHSLARLAADLEQAGSRLILRRGRSENVLSALAVESGAHEVHALHHVEPWWRNAERAVRKALDLQLHQGIYLAPPGSVLTGGGTPFKIYTPFWRALQERMPPAPPLPAPKLTAPEAWPNSDRLEDWQLLPTHPDWAGGMRAEWTPGEAGAAERLETFARRAARYAERRNLPAMLGTSRLSPHLHFGEVSPAQVWHGVANAGGSVDVFLGELGWRDYAANVIHQFPDYAAHSYKEEFERLPWRTGPEAEADLKAWQQGRTGYPIVDAGMRELWATGWMHNRVRMIVASFLIKHLLIDWRRGEEWFWDTLVDADYAQNAVNWQWSAGSGVDANMFVRIMAPLTQSPKFDAAGYIREWVPELAGLGDAEIHDPGLLRPRGYPAKIVEHTEGRARALAAHAAMKAV